VDLALQAMWERCNGNAPPADTKIARILSASGPNFVAQGFKSFESQMRPGIVASMGKLPALAADFSADLRDRMSQIKILCLSEINDSILMWSHYAQNHAGAVLEFADVEGLDSPYRVSMPVSYLAKTPQIADSAAMATMIAGGPPAFESGYLSRAICSKAAAWNYEREWRILTGGGRLPDEEVEYARFDRRELVGVYFGCRASEDFRAKAIETIKANYPNAVLWQCVPAYDAWAISFQAL
jgi:hypothetical protein